MASCTQCGSAIPDGSQFCNSCGARQEVSSASGATHDPLQAATPTLAPEPQKKRRGLLVVVAVIVVLVIAGALGLVSYQKDQARKAAEAAAAAKQLKAAKEEASRVLTKIEECESAVTVGVTLDDLSDKASTAREEVLSFSRSDYGKLLPDFTAAASQVADDYTQSCSTWFEDNKKAQAAWQAAYDKWDVLSGKPAPKLEDFKDDTKTQALWSQASADIAKARAALNVTPQ